MTDADFSPCRTFRYSLLRSWTVNDQVVNFIGLNPSTADETLDDPTIRRCVGFAKAWGFGGMRMLNLFAFRATDPKVMMAYGDPVGPENDAYLRKYIDAATVTVAAWGTGGWYRGRGPLIRDIYPALKVMRLTKDGHPAHPLYLPKTLVPMEWKC